MNRALPWFELISIENWIGLMRDSQIRRKERTNTCLLGISCSKTHLFLNPCLEKCCCLSASDLRGIVLCFWGPSVIQYEGTSTHLSYLFSPSTNLDDSSTGVEYFVHHWPLHPLSWKWSLVRKNLNKMPRWLMHFTRVFTFLTTFNFYSAYLNTNISPFLLKQAHYFSLDSYESNKWFFRHHCAPLLNIRTDSQRWDNNT